MNGWHVTRLRIQLWLPALLVLGSALMTTTVSAGVFLSSSDGDAASITHVSGYQGSNQELVVNFCIDPASESRQSADIAAQNVTIVWNALQDEGANLSTGFNNNIPPNRFDFESVLLHEMGHCLGLAHINLASESDLSGANLNYTQAQTGPNGVFDINAGPDFVIGSADDIRGDDINRNWFRIIDNNPFVAGDMFDRRSYSVDLADLPGNDVFAANADRSVGTLLGVFATEAVMQQGTRPDEAQRTLAADDVASLRLGMAGFDELQGTADDYSVRINYTGVAENCDVQLLIAGDDFAFCRVAIANDVTPNHSVIVTDSQQFGPAQIQIASTSEVNWFFNSQMLEPPPADPGPTGSWFNPSRNGEGWVIEVLNETTAGFYWFSYPPVGGDGQQLWLISVGEINGNTYTFDNVRIASGAVFGAGFDPADIVREFWGTLEFVFSDNDTAVVSYAGPPEFGSDSYNIQRFVRLDREAETAVLPAGISGSWFDPQTNGEGWVIEVISATQVVIYWFTFDENGNQAWNGGVADIVGNTLVLPDSRDSMGAAFGDDFDSNDIQRRDFGSLTFVFDDCNSGSLTFNTVRGNGVRDIQRITNLRGFSCEDFSAQ